MSCSPLKLLSWNVSGLKSKIDCYDSRNYLQSFDILCLSETWLDYPKQFSLKGYVEYSLTRKRKSQTAWRNSGGLSIFCKDHLDVQIVEEKVRDTHIWRKLPCLYEGKVIFLCAVYVPPENSDYADNDVFDQLEEDMVSLNSLYNYCLFMITGDFNARTGTLSDFIENSPNATVKQSRCYL